MTPKVRRIKAFAVPTGKELSVWDLLPYEHYECVAKKCRLIEVEIHILPTKKSKVR